MHGGATEAYNDDLYSKPLLLRYCAAVRDFFVFIDTLSLRLSFVVGFPREVGEENDENKGGE